MLRLLKLSWETYPPKHVWTVCLVLLFPLCTHNRNFSENHREFNPVDAPSESTMGPQLHKQKRQKGFTQHSQSSKQHCCLWSPLKKSEMESFPLESHSCLWAVISKGLSAHLPYMAKMQGFRAATLNSRKFWMEIMRKYCAATSIRTTEKKLIHQISSCVLRKWAAAWSLKMFADC